MFFLILSGLKFVGRSWKGARVIEQSRDISKLRTVYIHDIHHRIGYWLTLFTVGLVLFSWWRVGSLLQLDPTLAEFVAQYQRMMLSALPIAFFPLILALPAIRLSNASVTFGKLVRWKTFHWADLKSSDIQYCENCGDLRIECRDKSFRYSLQSISDSDRELLIDEFSRRGITVNAATALIEQRVNPHWTTQTAYEFSGGGITTIIGDDRRLFGWEEISSGSLEFQSSSDLPLDSLSFQIRHATIRLDDEQYRLRGKASCRCSNSRRVASLMKQHIDREALALTVPQPRLSEIESLEGVEKYHEEYRNQRALIYAAFLIRAVMILLILCLSGFRETAQPDADWSGSLAMILGLVALSMIIPWCCDRSQLAAIAKRREELSAG